MRHNSPIQHGLGHRARPRTAVQKELALRFAQAHQEALQKAVSFTLGHKVTKFLFGSVMAASYYLFAEKSRVQTESFFDELAEGSGLGAEHPVWVLRERLLTLQRNRDRGYRWASFGLCIKAWNKVRAGEKVKQFYVNTAEEFPKVE